MKELICIVCPKGCHLKVDEENGCAVTGKDVYKRQVFATGVPHWQEDWLRPLVIVPLIVQLFVAAYIGRYLFKRTGKVWLGAMVNTLIIVMMGVANTCTFLPL